MQTSARSLIETLVALPDLARRQYDADRILSFEGAGHIVHNLPTRADGRSVSLASRPWRLDPIPVVLADHEFEMLRLGAVARMSMMEQIIADLYGARSLIAERVIDADALWSSGRYRVAAIGSRPPRRWLTNYAVDVMQDVDGVWHVIDDATDAPAGVGYALLNRTVAARTHRDMVANVRAGDGLQPLDPFADRLRDGLADLSRVESPRIVVMSGGVDHPSFVEQSYLATRLGLNLAEGADLVVRQRRLWLRSLAGLERVDVLFRRLEDDRLDPMEVNTEGGAGIPGVLLAATSDNLRLANGHGCGVIEDDGLVDLWDAAGSWLGDRRGNTGTERQLLQRMPESVRHQHRWASAPCYDGERIVERPVMLRLHLVATNQGIEVLPGANVRVLSDGDDPFATKEASSKDLWVLGHHSGPRVGRRQPLPQVDLVASVPTRAAEALFWAGRALERTELVARSLRVVLDRTGGTADIAGAEQWVVPAIGMLANVTGLTLDRPTIEQARSQSSGPVAAPAALASSATALSQQLGSLLAEVSSVREFFSVTAGRVFARLAERRRDISTLVSSTITSSGVATRTADASVDDPRLAGQLEAGLLDSGLLDGVLVDIASVMGLWNESVVRGPAWRIGEIGRRIERVFGVIDAVRGAVEWSDMTELDDDAKRLIEVVLATNESLVAYRRRFRSDVEFAPAVELVVADDLNPRSIASALATVAHEAGLLGWADGERQANEMFDSLTSAKLQTQGSTARVLDALYSGCDTLARELVSAYLAAPVDPRTAGHR